VAHRANIALGWVDRSLRLRDMPSEGNAENTDQQGSVSWPLFVGAICRHQRVAAISTSASQPKAPRLRFPHAALTGVGKFFGGAGNAVVIMGSYCPALRRLGQFLKTAAQLVARIICHGQAASLLGRAAYPPITSSGIDGTSRIDVRVCSTSLYNGSPCVRLPHRVLPMHNNRRVIVVVQKVTFD
jgi:hypothetical protein